jgi:tetratricopeptide (TPR) repeat protein
MSGMRIASVTLAGPGTEGIIGDALRSVVDAVDICIVLDTGFGDNHDRIIDAVVEPTGRKYGIYWLQWQDDFAAMRNAALDQAARGNCDWALWLDTDERVQFQPDWREALNTSAAAVTAWHVSGEYNKERFVKLPRQGSYVGPTHECLALKKGRTMVDTRLVTFDELPRDKGSPAWTAKLERDVAALSTYAKTNKDARWAYFLGDSHFLLGDRRKAVQAWTRAVGASGAGEIRSWAAFRGAVAELADKHPDAALWLATAGLRVYPHAPELFWVAGAACFALGDYEAAIAWAMHCVAAGKYRGWGRGSTRSGFIYPPGLWEAPFDLLSVSYDKSGRPDLALTARQEYAAAKAAREGQ